MIKNVFTANIVFYKMLITFCTIALKKKPFTNYILLLNNTEIIFYSMFCQSSYYIRNGGLKYIKK